MGKTNEKKKGTSSFFPKGKLPMANKAQTKSPSTVEQQVGSKRSLSEQQEMAQIEEKQKRVDLDKTFYPLSDLFKTPGVLEGYTDEDPSDLTDPLPSASYQPSPSPLNPHGGAIRKSQNKDEKTTKEETTIQEYFWKGSSKESLIHLLTEQPHSNLLRRQILTSTEIIGTDVITEILMDFIKPLSYEEFQTKSEVAMSNLIYCQSGFLRGQEESRRMFQKEIRDLHLSIKDLKKTMEEHIRTMTENTSKLQNECTSVSADFRKMLSKMETTSINKHIRKDPNLALYHPVTSLKENVCYFTLDGKPCRITQDEGGNISFSLKNPKRLGLSAEVVKSFGDTLKALAPGVFSSIRDREIRDLLLDYSDNLGKNTGLDPIEILKSALNDYEQ